MSDQIKNISLKFTCDADWDSMSYVDGVKHCEHCQKKVYDFTDAKQHEFLIILAENNYNICGRFMPEQMAPKYQASSNWQKWVSAALFLIGINIFNNKAEAQQIKPHTQEVKFPPPIPAVGDVEIKSYDNMASFPGGEDAFKKFLLRNLHFDKKMANGRVFVSFDINKNGSLSNYKILRGLGPLNDNEVIRVLKLSPNWKPATLKGKPVIMNYVIPVHFDR